MKKFCPNSFGFSPILIVIILAFVLVFIGIIVFPKIKDTAKIAPSTTPSPSLTASPSATLAPTLAPTPQPTIATPTATTAPQTGSATPPDSGYSHMNIPTERGTFSADVVVVNGGTMVTDTANDSNCENDCPTKSLGDFVSSNGGFAGINGSYFCPGDYPDCQSKKNSFDFPVYNTRLSKWINEDKLFWNGRSIVYQDGNGIHMLQNANSFNGGLNAGVVNYPGLVDNGNIIAQNFGFSEKQSAKGTKGGVGFNGNKKFLVIAYGVDMMDFAHLFKSLGATYALNLDGGGSVALWYGGYVVGPGRGLPNAIIFK